MNQTNFVETELLLAALNDDGDEMLRLAQGMLRAGRAPSETRR